jgi:hypothetical protein
MDGDRLDAHLLTRPDNPARYLAAIGNQYFSKLIMRASRSRFSLDKLISFKHFRFSIFSLRFLVCARLPETKNEG